MAKVRVYQLAKQLNVQSALILELLDRLGQDVKSDLSTLDGDTADLVRERVTSAIAAETKRLEQEAAHTGPAPAPDAPAAAETPAEQPETAEAPAAAETPAPVETPAAPQPDPAAPATEVPAVEAPIAAKPAASTETPGAPAPATPAPVAAKPATRPASAEPAATAAETKRSPVGPLPGGAAPGARKPRVFAAKRRPTLASLNTPPAAPRTDRSPAGTRRPATGARTGAPGAPGAPGARQIPGRPPHHQRPGPGAPGNKARRRKKNKTPEVTQAPAKPRPDLPPVPEEITLSEAVTVKELAEKLNRKSKDVIAKLIGRGVLATINQPLDPEVAVEVALEFGSIASVLSFEEEAQQTAAEPAEVSTETKDADEDPSKMVTRPPVVTVMGHVDHGKTSLLDAIRTTNVVDREHGGITQHIGAYQVEENGKRITFLDTPGHEAFTLMRARGAKVTDIVVLVVAADDGVKPQTLEAIDHSKAAGVPIVVAINKVDKPDANIDRVKQQLMERELVVEDYGGNIVACEVSAKKRSGLDNLLEMILLETEMKELKANPEAPASGVVLEARRERSRGTIATLLIQNGTLKVGDAFIAGAAHGKVRAMVDENGKRVESAGPSTPVEVMGLNSEPYAGDTLQAVSDESKARQIASFRREKERAAAMQASAKRTLENLSRQIAKGDVKELPVLLKADVQGSIEAIEKSLGELPSDKIRVNVLRSSIGAITQADVLLAAASNAIVIGFNVRPDRVTADLAKREEVEIRQYTVIYDVIDEVKQAMLGMLEPTLRESVLGQAEVRQTFKVPKIGNIGGCYVTDGKIARKGELRLIRDNVVIYTGKVGSLRRFKDDVSEVKSGYECGIGIAGYNDIKVGDVIECFVTEKVAAESL